MSPFSVTMTVENLNHRGNHATAWLPPSWPWKLIIMVTWKPFPQHKDLPSAWELKVQNRQSQQGPLGEVWRWMIEILQIYQPQRTHQFYSTTQNSRSLVIWPQQDQISIMARYVNHHESSVYNLSLLAKRNTVDPLLVQTIVVSWPLQASNSWNSCLQTI